MSEFHKLSKQERIKLANDLNKGSMRQTAILYGGILIVVVVSILVGNSF
jgi:hypothetical protein